MSFIKKIKSKIKEELQKNRVKNKTKFFCIGSGKTGTTSIEIAFKELGFVVGNQRQAELLTIDCFEKNYQPLINYCKTAEVFQDVPFAFLDIYKVLDQHFPGSKFILSVRDSSEQWYESLTNFHTKRFGKGNLPNWEDLKKIDYVYKGWSYENRKYVYGLNEYDDPYDKAKLIHYYERRNQEIIEYFKNRPNDLLVINLSDLKAYQKFCNFIGVKSDKMNFPWENKTEDIKL